MLNKIIQILTLLLIPTAALYFSSTRQISILWKFVKNEIFTQSGTILVFLIFSIIIFLVLCRFSNKAKKVLVYFSKSFKEYPEKWFLVLIIIIISLIPYYSIRYKSYSETSFQKEALLQIKKENYIKARHVCKSYVELYPQRKEGNIFSDSICTPYLKYYKKMVMLDKYVSSYVVNKNRIDDLEIPADWNARKYSTYLTGQWSGHKKYHANLSTAVKPMSQQRKMVKWGEMPQHNSTIKNSRVTLLNSQCKYKIQIFSFRNKQHAFKVMNKLKVELKRNITTEDALIDEKKYTRVIIPCVTSKELAKEIIRNGKIKSALIIKN